MKLLHTEITPLINEYFYVDLRHQPYFASPFHSRPSLHAHPEIELVFILEGFGKRIIGNKVESFESGDMALIGSNVPHVWLSDPVFYEKNSGLQSKVIITYFNPKIFQQVLDTVKEFSNIRETIQQASKGIGIFGETRRVIAERLLSLANKTGYEKVEGLLRIINMISLSDEKKYILTNEEVNNDVPHPDRLVNVIKFIKDNIEEQISLKNVADVACMTEQSFCRFFKKKTNMNLSQFLNDLRIARARELLIRTDKPISDIAYLSGYNSPSHFCKVFKDQTGLSPLQFKSGINDGKE